MRTPFFWGPGGGGFPLLPLLRPLSGIYAAGAARRWRRVQPVRVGPPILCVGNVTAGGAGKTPVVIALAQRLQAAGAAVRIVSRGYGGRLRGPVRVDPEGHDARAVGDEPLLLARHAPVWIGRDRVAAARAAAADGADVLILDDGYQNPSLEKDLSLLVFDGGYGIGNGELLPAGPLRETPEAALARADASVLLGPDTVGIGPALAQAGPPLLTARLMTWRVPFAPGSAVVAFAGIGRPAKFFDTIEECGGRLLARDSFPDHHVYSEPALARLKAMARRLDAHLVTTEKDLVRIPPRLRDGVEALGVDVAFDDEAALDRLLAAHTGWAPPDGASDP